MALQYINYIKRHVLAGDSSMMMIQYDSRHHCHADMPGRPKARAGAESFGPIATSNHVWFQCTDNNEPFSLSVLDTMCSHSQKAKTEPSINLHNKHFIICSLRTIRYQKVF